VRIESSEEILIFMVSCSSGDFYQKMRSKCKIFFVGPWSAFTMRLAAWSKRTSTRAISKSG